MESGVLWLWGPVVAGETGPGATEIARFLIPVGADAAAGDPAPGDSTDCRGDGPDMMKSTGNRCCVVVASSSLSVGRLSQIGSEFRTVNLNSQTQSM